jgi:hypothetical protein
MGASFAKIANFAIVLFNLPDFLQMSNTQLPYYKLSIAITANSKKVKAIFS